MEPNESDSEERLSSRSLSIYWPHHHGPEAQRSSSSSEEEESDHNNDDDPIVDEQIRSLSCDHQYLGELEPVRGREIMDDHSIQKIPLLSPPSPIVLVPGQNYPLVVTDNKSKIVLKYAVEKNHIIGILPNSILNLRRLRGAVGTTAEIIAHLADDLYKVKAVGRQRFKIVQAVNELIDGYYITFVYIKILPEITLKPALESIKISSSNRYRSGQRFKCLHRDSSQTKWPAWLFYSYDEKYLMEKLKEKLTKKFRLSKNIKYSDDPNTLFFQLLKSIPFPQRLISGAMELNTSIERLQWLIDNLEPKSDKLKCISCLTTIGTCSDIFAMSNEGPHGTFVNTHGYVFEMITLKKVKNINMPEPSPETAFSWFPGYGWSIIYCRCEYHIGWKFTANDNQSPAEFWAVKNDAISVKSCKQRRSNDDDDDDEGSTPVTYRLRTTVIPPNHARRRLRLSLLR